MKALNIPRPRRPRRTVGVTGAELLRRLKAVRFTPAEQRELKAAMDASAKVFGHAGSH